MCVALLFEVTVSNRARKFSIQKCSPGVPFTILGLSIHDDCGTGEDHVSGSTIKACTADPFHAISTDLRVRLNLGISLNLWRSTDLTHFDSVCSQFNLTSLVLLSNRNG